jgi:hypothetical protein
MLMDGDILSFVDGERIDCGDVRFDAVIFLSGGEEVSEGGGDVSGFGKLSSASICGVASLIGFGVAISSSVLIVSGKISIFSSISGSSGGSESSSRGGGMYSSG